MRNRSEGWVHAKLSGHINEKRLEELLSSDVQYAADFSKRFGKDGISSLMIGGLCETSVPSIFGKSTKSKVDMLINWEDNSNSRISIKKSNGGQVYLIRTNRFIDGFEFHYGSIPEEVKRGLRLYFGEGEEAKNLIESPFLIENVEEELIAYQKRKKRLVWDSLVKLDPDLASSLLIWFRENIGRIAEFCFSKGLAISDSDWAEYIWYKNMVDEEDFDEIISISELSRRSVNNSDLLIRPGRGNGGSTILLPFGFVQWHQGSMQFHHNLNAIRSLWNEEDELKMLR
jgi:hypothetical protein